MLILSRLASLVPFLGISYVRAEDDMVKFHYPLGAQGNEKTFEKVDSLGSTLLVKYENPFAALGRTIRVR